VKFNYQKCYETVECRKSGQETDAPRRSGGINIGLKCPDRVQHCLRIHSTR